MSTNAHKRERGLTLIELVMFIMIVSIALVGVLSVLNITSKNSADPQVRKQALSIAEGLLEEVELAHFTYCDPTDASVDRASGANLTATGCASIVENAGQTGLEPVGSRPYDNVNDYVDAYGTAKTYTSDANGTNLPTGYTATVNVVPEALNGIASSGTAANVEVLRITVVVTNTYNNDTITLDGYRTRYAPNYVP
ncbi:MAG TPA: type II secretion system protein [Burkholderiaceae bacterium]|jgi:MSHA pilin protein MshD